MSSTPESLTKDLPLWKKPGEIIVDSKSPTIISEDKTILFQLLFALYVANSKYGINPKNIGNFEVRTETEHEMMFALESGGDYDVFKFNTTNHVVLDYPFTVNETKQDLDTTAIANYFSILLDKTPAGKLLKAQLNDPLQDYGTGMEWGLNLALFHPFFYSYYSGETTTKPTPMDEKMIYYHEPMWSKLEQTKKDARSKEVEDAFKKGKTYTLENFENVIESLLNLWDTTYSAGFDDGDQGDYDSSVEALKEAYRQFRIIYPDDNVQGMGKLTYFSAYTTRLKVVTGYVEDKLVSVDKFEPAPKQSGYAEVGPRTRGYISVFLSIIALIVEKKFYLNSKDIDAALKSSSEFLETTLPVKQIFDNFNNYFRGTANSIQKLQNDYAALETAYNNYKNSIVFRANKHPLSNTKLEKAQSLIKALDASNFTNNEAAARQALAEAQGDEKEWKRQSDASAAEKKQYEDIEARLKALQTDYNDTKTKYDNLGDPKWATADPGWPDLNLLEQSKDFNTNVAVVQTTLDDIEKIQLKNLKDEFKKKENFNKQINLVLGHYNTCNTTHTESLKRPASDYIESWKDFSFISDRITDSRVILTSITPGMDTTRITNLIAQMEALKNGVKKHAFESQRNYEGNNLQEAYVKKNVTDTTIENEINAFKALNSDSNEKTILDTKQKDILAKINQLKKPGDNLVATKSELNLDLYVLSDNTKEGLKLEFSKLKTTPSGLILSGYEQQIDEISSDSFRLTGLLHAMWGATQNPPNTEALVKGLNMMG